MVKKALKFFSESEFRYCGENLVYFAENYCMFEDRDAPGVVVKFCPWMEQRQALEAIHESRYTLFLKARQIGITWIALIYCAWDMIFNTGHSIIAISKTQKDADELVRRLGVILSNMEALLAGGNRRFEIHKSKVSVYKSGESGKKSLFTSFAASKSAGRSFTANILLIDEWAFQEWAREIWTSAYPTVNRPTGGKVIGISTIKRGTLFEELWTGNNNFRKIFISVFADPRRSEEWYEATKRDLGELIRQEYPRTAEEALQNAGGLFFHEFDPIKHICAEFSPLPGWRIYGTMDYGLDMLAYYAVAVDTQGRCYVIGEIYESGLVVSEAAERIGAFEKKLGIRPYARFAPPDLFCRELTSGKSQAAGFEERGIRLTKASNDRRTGWIYLKELLRGALRPDGTIAPGMMIFAGCRNLIRTLGAILAERDDPTDCAVTPHELTHAPDAIRYFAVSWYRAGKAEEKRVINHARADIAEDYANADPETKERILEKMR